MDIRLDAGRSERTRRGMISSVAGSGIGEDDIEF